MENLMSKYPVLVSELTLTKVTAKLTGLETVEELLKAKSTLFKDYTPDRVLDTIINDLHKGKLNKLRTNEITQMSPAEQRKYLISNMAVQVAFIQGRESAVSDTKVSKRLGFFMADRVDTGSSQGTKYGFTPISLGQFEKLNLKVDDNATEKFSKMGVFIYIQRITDFIPEVNKETKNINSEPKRAGKGGDILTLNGKLLFQHSQLIIEEDMPAEEMATQFGILYDEETENELQYKYDPDGSIPADTIPAAVWDKEKARFNPEFQDWLNNEYNTRVQLHTTVGQANAILNEY